MKPLALFSETQPALFLAPLASLTHSPFRRLLSDFGGYSALYSEMLHGKGLLSEQFDVSTYTRRRVEEGHVVYQLQISNEDPIEEILSRLLIGSNPFAIDLNLGCPAPSARAKKTGALLFLYYEDVQSILTRIRSLWSGPLSVKFRLGSRLDEDQEKHFFRMIDLFGKFNLSWMTLHPRFMEDQLRRGPYYDWFKRIAAVSSIPLIGNGNISRPDQLGNPEFEELSGVMIGRAAVCRPWIFRQISDPTFDVSSIDYQEVWNRFFTYVSQEFIPTKAVGRVKLFTSYYCQNFKFGHSLFTKMMHVRSLEKLYDDSNRFFDTNPTLVDELRIKEF